MEAEARRRPGWPPLAVVAPVLLVVAFLLAPPLVQVLAVLCVLGLAALEAVRYARSRALRALVDHDHVRPPARDCAWAPLPATRFVAVIAGQGRRLNGRLEPADARDEPVVEAAVQPEPAIDQQPPEIERDEPEPEPEPEFHDLVSQLLPPAGEPARARRLAHRVADLSPTRFEELVAGTLRRLGFEHLDQHEDAMIVCVDPAGRLVCVQCPEDETDATVNRTHLAPFVRRARGADRAIFVSRTGFTSAARALADRSGIHLLTAGQVIRILTGDDPQAAAKLRDPPALGGS